MLDVGTFLEYYGLVGIIVSGRSVDVEATRQFGIDDYFILLFKGLGKVHFYALRIDYYEVVEWLLLFHGIDAQLAFQGWCTENVRVKGLVEFVICHVFYYSNGFALVNDVACLDNELFRINPEQIESCWILFFVIW